jgi:hypothetical protein
MAIGNPALAAWAGQVVPVADPEQERRALPGLSPARNCRAAA